MLPSDIEAFQDVTNKYKLCILGQSTVGKTKLLIRYRDNSYEDSGNMTVGIDHVLIRHMYQKTTYQFDYYDTAGQERFESTVNLFLKNTDACLLVYDLNSQKSLPKMKTFYNILKEISPNALIAVVGNKKDLDQNINLADLQFYAQQNIQCFTASAKTGEGVQEVFEYLETNLIKKLPTQKPVSRRTRKLSVHLHSEKEAKKKCCS